MPSSSSTSAAKSAPPILAEVLVVEPPRRTWHSAMVSLFHGGRESKVEQERRAEWTPRPPTSPRPAPESERISGHAESYFQRLSTAWATQDWASVEHLFRTLQNAWSTQSQVFLCGNGGSAANAIHLANDLLYGVSKTDGRGLRVNALPANASVLTCLANDVSYDDVFAQQLSVLAGPGDILIALSGSGNSPNILKAITRAKEIGMTTFAILGFTGGKARELSDHPIHFPVHDMQIAEDLQMMIGHMAMQWLSRNGR